MQRFFNIIVLALIMILNSLAQEENYLLDEPLITDEQALETNLLTEEGLMKIVSL